MGWAIGRCILQTLPCPRVCGRTDRSLACLFLDRCLCISSCDWARVGLEVRWIEVQQPRRLCRVSTPNPSVSQHPRTNVAFHNSLNASLYTLQQTRALSWRLSHSFPRACPQRLAPYPQTDLVVRVPKQRRYPWYPLFCQPLTRFPKLPEIVGTLISCAPK